MLPFEDTQPAVTYGANGEIMLSPNLRRGPVRYVPVVGVLMIVQSAIEIGFATVFGLIGIWGLPYFSWLTATDPTVDGWTEEGFNAFALPFYGGISFGLLILAAMRIYSGWRTIHYRSRGLAKTVLKLGFATLVLGFYPFPTALILGIFGIQILNNRAVQASYELVEAGYDPKQVREIFKTLPG